HRVPDAETVVAPVDEMRVSPHPRPVVKAARAAQCRSALLRLPLAHQALEFGDRHRAVVLRLDFGIGVEFEAPRYAPPAAPDLFDGGEPRRRGDLVKFIAGLLEGRARQHWQRRSWCRRG